MHVSSFLAFWVFLGCNAAVAQETAGAITGTVSDPSHGVIAAAVVEVTSPSLVRTQKISTDKRGDFQFQRLPPGTYSLTAAAPGFRTLRESGITVSIGRTSFVALQLEVGQVTESLEIQSDAVRVDTTTSSATTTVRFEFFDRMPKGRSFDSLVVLAPGARREPKSGLYQIDGASGAEHAWVIDGLEQSDIQNGLLNFGARLPFEFVQEVQVKSSGFEAQYPAATGGVINTVTRGGGNDFHGQAGLYFDNDVLNARPRPTLRLSPFDTTGTLVEYFQNQRDPYRTLGPVLMLGGRIVRNKAWFFAGWSPLLTRTTRVTSLFDDPARTPREFSAASRSDNLSGKIDYAPFARMRTSFSYLYSPSRTNGVLPALDGSSRSNIAFSQLGFRSPAASYSWSSTWSPAGTLLVNYHGGFVYTNTKSYGVPGGVTYNYGNSSIGLPGVPANLQAPAGRFTPSTFQTVFDKNNRQVHYLDVDYIASAWGQHNLKAGYSINRLSNKVERGYPNGSFYIGWNLSYTGVSVDSTMRGAYGYYLYIVTGTLGKVASNNEGFYIQDNWKLHRRLTLNLGVRFDREFVPSFRTDAGQPPHAIEWGFGDKAAPRLGFAWDILGDARWTIKGGFGRLFDQFKYALPRSSFGGTRDLEYAYPLDDPDITQLTPNHRPGKLFELVDFFVPANDPNHNRVDPNLAPFQKHFYNLESDYLVNSTTVLSVRYTRNRLDRAIEDMGTLTNDGVVYYIGNPGYGLVADPSKFPPGVPSPPMAVTNYDALEFRVERRFARHFLYSASYAYSRLWGNYSGLVSSDEGGQALPNVTRAFDLPWEHYDAQGRPAYGLLATDRPHSFKFFGSYSINTRAGETRISPVLNAWSGTPLSTQVTVVSVPMLVNGRGDMGRTPAYINTDLQLAHEVKVFRSREGCCRIRLQSDVFNVLNQSSITNRVVNYIHPADGALRFTNQDDIFKGFDYKALMQAQKKRASPLYGLANGFQDGRFVRIAIHFLF